MNIENKTSPPIKRIHSLKDSEYNIEPLMKLIATIYNQTNVTV